MNADRRPGVGAPDYEKYMMAQPVPVEPGSAFCYSSADSILAAHMVERAVGKRMGEYLYEKVFQPLDMGWPPARKPPARLWKVRRAGSRL